MKQKYQALVHRTIPVSKAIGWEIMELDPIAIETSVRLEPNINIHGTGFAGSIFAGAMATGWTLMRCWYQSNGFEVELVAAEANIKYVKPVTGDFTCVARIDETSEPFLKLFSRMQSKRSCGYLLDVDVMVGQSQCASLSIQFVFKAKSG